jgi:hypothetical protein
VNLLKSPLRRTTAILAGAVLGMAGAVALAAPASATHPTVTGSATCVSETGWTVTWKVTNEWPNKGEIKDVKVLLPEGGTLTAGGGIVIGAAVKHKRDKQELVSEQVVPANEPKAKLRVAVLFDNGHREGGENLVNRPTEPCKPPASPSPSPSPSASASASPSPSVSPSTSPSTSPSVSPSASPSPGEPEPIIEMTCDSLSFGLDNTNGQETVEVTIKSSKGETRELVVKPGEKKVEKFSASAGFALTVTDKASGESVELPYTQPADCDSAGGGGGDGELPLTGAAAGGIAGGAALLLAVGAGLFIMARRRRVKFTA